VQFIRNSVGNYAAPADDSKHPIATAFARYPFPTLTGIRAINLLPEAISQRASLLGVGPGLAATRAISSRPLILAIPDFSTAERTVALKPDSPIHAYRITDAT
jgi:hypothetical protein